MQSIAITPQIQNLNINFSQSLDLFFKEQDLREKSKITYEKAFRSFFSYIRTNDIRTPQRLDILNYKESLRDKSPYTISGYITAVRKLFEWLESSLEYPNIARGIKGAKLPRGFNKDTLTLEQIKTLLNSINLYGQINRRDYALLNLLLRTGLRTIEIQRANIEDIRQQGGKALLYIQGKGRDSKDNFVILTENTLKPIHAYLSLRKNYKQSEPLFVGAGNRNKGRLTTESISRIIKTRMRAAGIDQKTISAHSLRHTAITLSLLAGASLQEACELARHKSISTTQIYAHNINRLSDNAPEHKIDEILK